MQSIIPKQKQSLRRKNATDSRIQEYKKTRKNILVTTRFNNSTWSENIAYRKQHEKLGCIYPSPEQNGNQIPSDAILFVLEMNNETNKIIGIGMVRNHSIPQKYLVYSNQNYNRYAYLGKYRIDRGSMNEEEERIMKVFDILCFTGSRHMKRLQGLKTFPVDILYRCSQILDLVDFIGQMFKSRMSEQINESK